MSFWVEGFLPGAIAMGFGTLVLLMLRLRGASARRQVHAMGLTASVAMGFMMSISGGRLDIVMLLILVPWFAVCVAGLMELVRWLDHKRGRSHLWE